MAELRLPDDKLAELFGAALLTYLDDAKRDLLIQEAVRSLITKDTQRFGDGKSTLQRAFERAAESVATEIARKRFAEDAPFKAEVEKLFNDAWARATKDREKLVTALASAFSEKLARLNE